MKRGKAFGAFGLLALGFFLAALGLWKQGPLWGDLSVTLFLQGLLGTEPFWAFWVTDSAKFPMVLGLLLPALLWAWMLAGVQGLGTVGASFLLAKAIDPVLRALIYAPKPTEDLVPVAVHSSSSGLPSTFAFVYGSIFAALILLQASGRAQGSRLSLWISGLLLLVLLMACLSRVVLAGHWSSQMLASLMVISALTFFVHKAIGSVPWLKRPRKDPSPTHRLC